MKRNDIVQKLRELAKESKGIQILCPMTSGVIGLQASDSMCNVDAEDAIYYLADMLEE